MREVSEKQTAKLGRKRPSAGFTVLEMIIATASAVVLMGGLSSALYIGAQSLDVSTGSQTETRTANAALATIKRDLQEAISISDLTSTSVTMTVPDRDNDAVAETIRYAWSGSVGDPLTQSYNGLAATMLAEDVQSFSLDWIQRLINGSSLTSTDWTSTDGISTRPFVLFVSGEAPDAVTGITTPSTTEQDRIDLIEGWDFVVRVISQDASLAEFDDQLKLSNVVYVSGETVGWAINTKLNPVTHGVVTESFANAVSLGFYGSLTPASADSSVISITNPLHYITETYSVIDLEIFGADQELKGVAPTAVDTAMLASADTGSHPPSLLILDAGDELADGGLAAGRRCQLPWGEGGFDPTALNAEGQTLMRRAIEWAAGAGEDTATPWILFHEFTEKQRGSKKSNIKIDVPPSYAEGDLLIATVVTNDDTSGSLSPPVGWNEVLVSTESSGKVTLGVWWKLATASEPPQYVFNWSSSEQAYGYIMRFTGHDPANPINAMATNEGVSDSPTAPALNTTFDDSLILRIGAFNDDNVNIYDAGMSGHWTVTANESSNGSGTTSGAAAYQMQADAGTCGTATFSLTGGEEYLTLTIAIAPDPNP